MQEGHSFDALVAAILGPKVGFLATTVVMYNQVRHINGWFCSLSGCVCCLSGCLCCPNGCVYMLNGCF